MNTLARPFVALCALLLIASLHADELTVAVTPKTMAGWAISGARPDAVSSLLKLVLLPRAQLSRQVSVPDLSVLPR